MANSIPPLELGARGRELWAAIESADPAAVSTADVRRPVAVEACRAADQLETLAGILHTEGPLTVGGMGGTVIHPAATERDRLAPMMARLIVALRLPDAKTGAKPQNRPMRGTTGTHALGTTALERARAAAA